MAEPTYKRLTWSRTRRKSAITALRAPRQSLWLTHDHLLSIDSASFAEEYKRFYFRDIQAFFICPNSRMAIWNGILSAVLIMHLLVFGWMGASFTVLAIVAAVLGIPLIINNIFGPACRVYVRTSVQVEELPSLSRIKRAQRVLDKVRPLVIAVQGTLPAENPQEATEEQMQ